MAKIVVGAEVTVRTDQASKSVGSLKQQLREAQADVAALSEKFGATSASAIEAAKRAAGLKDAIGDAKALTDAFNPDRKFQAFSSALQGVAGGFAAVQGAQALLGVKSEELEKTLLKVQGAMALSQGINSLLEAGDAFKNLKAVAINALNGIRNAIGATGIGLLVIALGTIYAYWDDIKGAVDGVSQEQSKLNEKVNANLTAEKEKLKNINSQDNILKLQGKSEKEILKIKINQIDAVILATKASIAQAEITKKAQVDAAKRNKEILEGLLNFLSIPITAVLFAVDKIKGVFGETSTLLKDYKSGLANFVFDPEKTAKDGDKVIKEQNDALTQLLNDRAGFLLQIKGINKQAAKDAASDADKLAKTNEDIQKEAQNTATDNANKSNDRRKKEFEDRQAHLKNLASLDLQDSANRELTLEERLNKINERERLANQIVFANEDERTAYSKANAEARKQIAEDEAQAKVAAAQFYADSLNAIADLIGKDTATGKALAVAAALTSTYLSAQKAYESQFKPLAIVDSPVRGAIAAGVAVASGLANVKKILAVKIPGRSGGGANLGSGSSFVTAPIGPQLGGTQLNQGQVNQLSNAANRAFVLESDVSGNQERIERLNRAARIN
jgi:hypothetical protein